jgi:hypothetical protein
VMPVTSATGMVVRYATYVGRWWTRARVGLALPYKLRRAGPAHGRRLGCGLPLEGGGLMMI